MNGGATIFDDRETVELLRDRPELLAIADAVRATQSQSNRYRRPVLFAAVAAAVVGAAIAGLALSGAFGGGAAEVKTARHHVVVARGMAPFPPMTVNYTRSGSAVSSIAVTVRDDQFADATMQLQVVRSDASSVLEAERGKGGTQVVFQEQVAMTSTGSTAPDTALSTWSGTLSPSDWSGGCQHALYNIRTTVYSAGSSITDPFDSTATDRSGSAWFNCSRSWSLDLPGTGLGALLGPAGEYSTVELPTLTRPLAHGQQTTLAKASDAWGTRLALPSTTLVKPSDAGPVWERTVGLKTVAVVVTFPAQALMVMYLRGVNPAVPFRDPQTAYQQLAKGIAGSQVVDLNGRPALVVAQNSYSDSAGRNLGVAAFQLSDSEVVLMGNVDNAALQDAARSILDHTGS